MKKTILSFLSFALFFATTVCAQTVDEIIAKHVEALGGNDKISQVKSIYTENTMEVMGSSAPVLEYTLDGKGFKSETQFNGTTIIAVLNDKSGWTVNPLAGNNSPQSMPDEIYKAGKSQIYAIGALPGYAAKGLKAELAGMEGNNFKIKLIDGNSETIYLVDSSTYMINKRISKSEMMGNVVEAVTTFADYKKTDFGLMVPYQRDMDLGGFLIAVRTDKVEINKEIDPAMFQQKN